MEGPFVGDAGLRICLVAERIVPSVRGREGGHRLDVAHAAMRGERRERGRRPGELDGAQCGELAHDPEAERLRGDTAGEADDGAVAGEARRGERSRRRRRARPVHREVRPRRP